MKPDWKALATKIDDMSLRERGMLFASACLVLLVAAHVVFIDPMLRAQKALIETTARNNSQIQAVRAQLEQIMRARTDPAGNPQAQALRALEQRLEEANRATAAREGEFLAPERLPALLRELLGGNRELELISLKLLAGTPVAEAGGEFHRHGVELTMRGSYFDLVRYLEDLEKLPAAILWGKANLEVDPHPQIRLTLTVHTLSRQRTLF